MKSKSDDAGSTNGLVFILEKEPNMQLYLSGIALFSDASKI
jgi:hypothetical protein